MFINTWHSVSKLTSSNKNHLVYPAAFHWESRRKMEITTGNSDLSTGRRGLCLIEGDSVETKCIRRRRRDHSAVTLSCNDQQNDQQQQQSQGDKSNISATTVKRSSRFRGVSRFVTEFRSLQVFLLCIIYDAIVVFACWRNLKLNSCA